MLLYQYILDNLDNDHINIPYGVGSTLEGLCMVTILQKLGRNITLDQEHFDDEFDLYQKILCLMFQDDILADHWVYKSIRKNHQNLVQKYLLHGTTYARIVCPDLQHTELNPPIYDTWNELFEGRLPPMWYKPNTDYMEIDTILDIYNQKDEEKITISWDYRDAINNDFLVYVNLLVMQEKIIVLDDRYHENIKYTISDYHIISPIDEKRYSTHVLILMGLAYANIESFNLRCACTNQGKYVFNQKVIRDLEQLLIELDFPSSPLEAVFRSIRMPGMFSEEDEQFEIGTRSTCFDELPSNDLIDRVMYHIGLGQSTKSARNI